MPKSLSTSATRRPGSQLARKLRDDRRGQRPISPLHCFRLLADGSATPIKASRASSAASDSSWVVELVAPEEEDVQATEANALITNISTTSKLIMFPAKSCKKTFWPFVDETLNRGNGESLEQ